MYLCIYQHIFVSSIYDIYLSVCLSFYLSCIVYQLLFKKMFIVIFLTLSINYSYIFINLSSVIYMSIIYLSIRFKPVFSCQRLTVDVLCALPWSSHFVDHNRREERLHLVHRFNNTI